MTAYYLDIHVLQSVPPSNVNRDDTGAPKSALYGGVRRARVSSQAWKKAVRASFDEFVDPEKRGVRTLRVIELLVDRMKEMKVDLPVDEMVARAVKVVGALGLKTEKPRVKKDEPEKIERSQYLIFFSRHQLDRLAELAATAEGAVTKRDAQQAADTDHGIDVSLFGRMVADSKDLNVDSAVQVAHAISTHAAETEADYFTAVDDYKLDEDDAGAGMIGTIEFNSSTLYRFATVSLTELLHNLGDVGLTAEAAAAFVQGFIVSMPTGKQNTFGNNTLPDAVLVQLREGRSVSYVGAFEAAVEADGGYVRPSVDALAKHVTELQKSFLDSAAVSLVTRTANAGVALDQLGEVVSLLELVDRSREAAAAVLADQASS
ncbi:type I-E CRISPR-associated protein Cas7/Cse4/CasC [Tessaracoccus aquimaris]|uniref:Type I-E CRISPR-associated protein Cas7/Cse4/CasC n=1 Tax=Tessaracoccus aquimaris TaxID=1332264 RepID=A0A1Q2CR25_9ACTN|nr:type I-E CRISPR-associated protein Cas7/Cse4/CasC [Tessaracoccus aquimaris]AQP48573.1 type I-E CRISPR-associated protein Cas7/Cse4/CasC [Tessaracoccus aquimaris]